MNNIARFFAAALLGLPFFTAAQVVDTVPPQLKCKAMLIANACLSTGNGLQIFASGFVESVTDNVSPTSAISLGVRTKCTGDGFPNNKNYVQFNTTELGYANVELWAKDQAGNTSSCQTQVEVVDHGGFCDPFLSIVAYTPKDSITKIGGAIVAIDKSTCQNDSIHTSLELPAYWAGALSIPGNLLTVTPSKIDNPLNGVSAYDLVLISKHILGLSKLSAPQLIAADANRDGKVTTYDIVLLRQLILGIIPELPGGVSWRFWPYDYEFPDPDNPFSPPFPERIEVPRSADPVPNRFMFFGVKIGDVNYSADLK